MRLTDGSVFPIPITLPVTKDDPIKIGSDIALRNSKNELLAVMTVEDVYPWDREEVAEKIFGTTDLRHPLVAEMHRWGDQNISGRLQVLQLPTHFDFKDLRLTPERMWWRFRPAIPCTEFTKNSQSGRSKR
jgi:sulfate adenylyltransferase